MNDEREQAFFEADNGRFMPTPHSRGPWDPKSMHGRVVAGLLGCTLEQRYCDDGLQFTRLTIDLFRLPPMAPLEVQTELIREGGRIKVADGVVLADGLEIARARGVMLRRASDPEGQVWRPADWDVPSPEELIKAEGSLGRMWETRPISGGDFGGVVQRRTWLRETRLLVAGEPLTPFVRCAVAADYTNPFANSGSAGLNFVNADITLYLHRLPVDEWLGFEVCSHQSQDGIAVGESTLYDRNGPIGKSLVCAVANRHNR